MNRRQILIGAAAVAGLALAATGSRMGAAGGEQPALFPDDRVLGAADAPVTIIEYSSLTCPHCASLHEGALPRIKETWVADGKAKLVYRHFPLDGLALRAAAVANCLEGERHFGFLDLLFKTQERWARAADPIEALGQVARLAGMDQARFDGCVGDSAEMDRILARAQDAQRAYGVQSTPTLLINGEKIEGARSFEEIEAIFEKAAARS